MASKKERKLASPGDAAGMAAIRIWAMQIETVMISRYAGNAPTLAKIRKIATETVRKIHDIKPALMSDCQGWPHLPNCECDPTV